MAEYTNNINLEKPSGNENFRRQVINDNMDRVDKKFGTGADEGHTHDGTAGQGKKISYNSLTDKPASAATVAGGTGTAITLAIQSFVAYTDKSLLTFIATTANSGAATTININSLGAKPLYKPNTAVAPSLAAGKAYTVWYDSSGGCFFIKASAEGTAVAANVLAGTTFSNDNDTGLAGSMVNNGPAVAETINLTTEGAEYTIAAGFHTGLRKIKTAITNIAAAMIKAGVTVGGVVGTFTADATATAPQILAGITAYVNGTKVTGTMPDRRGVNSAAQEVVTYGDGRLYLRPLGGCWDGVYWTYYDDLDFINTNFLDNKNVFGLQGAIPVMSTKNPDGLGAGRSEALAVSAASNTLFVKPKQGYYSGADDWTHVTGMGFDSNNWPTGVSVLGVAGTMPNRGTPTLQPGDAIPYGYYGGGSVAQKDSVAIILLDTEQTYNYDVNQGFVLSVKVKAGTYHVKYNIRNVFTARQLWYNLNYNTTNPVLLTSGQINTGDSTYHMIQDTVTVPVDTSIQLYLSSSGSGGQINMNFFQIGNIY